MTRPHGYCFSTCANTALGLRQPEGHVHRTIQLNARAERGTRLLPLAGRGIQCTQATMAVRLERAHAQFLGQGEGLLVGGVGLFNLWRLVTRRNVAEEAQGIRLVAAFLMFAGERQRPLGERHASSTRLGSHQRLPQGETTECLIDDRCNGLFHGLREQRHGVGDAPGEEYAAPKDAACLGKKNGMSTS